MARGLSIVVALLVVGRVASGATCPPDCVAGGGPPANDCLLQYGGISATTVTCTDGNPACDADGAIDGVCRFRLTACVGVASRGCTPAALTAPPTVTPATGSAAQAFVAALAPLVGQGSACATAGVAVPVRTSLTRVSPGTARLAVVARAGARRDRDRLKLTCLPAATAPSLAAAVQPILTAHCAVPGCHHGDPPTSEPSLDTGRTWAATVNVGSLNAPTLRLVVPGNIAGSYLVRKILRKRIIDHTAAMPLGCPKAPPPTGCLSPGDTAAILAWIEAGAPDR